MSINKSVQISLALSGISLFSPTLVRAIDIGGTDVTIEPSLTTGVMYYAFEQDAISITGSDFNLTQEKIKFSDIMPTLGVGLGVGIGDFSIKLSAQRAFNGSDSDTVSSSYFREGNIINIEGNNVQYNSSYQTEVANFNPDFNRNDYSASVGYSLSKQVSMYAGYKWAKTEFKDTPNIIFQVTQFPDRLGGAFTDRDQFSGETKQQFEYEFKNQGPFIGLNYGLDYKEGILNGKLYFSVAAAFLEGEIKKKNFRSDSKITEIDGQPLSPPLVQRIKEDTVGFTKGDTVGFTFGVSWIGETSISGLAYALGVQGYQYQFDANDANSVNTNETVVQFNMGISYVF